MRIHSRNSSSSSRLHGDLREEHHVVGQRSQARQKLEALGTDCTELFYPRRIPLALSQLDVAVRHRVEVVVGEEDEAEPL
ncbi:MAG: hypothetical protein R2724_03705 [Bryobacterales bacterium]